MYVSLASKCTKCTVKTDAPEYKLTKVHYAIIKHNIQHCPSMVYIKTNYGLSKWPVTSLKFTDKIEPVEKLRWPTTDF